jgi:hypothetical protein
MNTYRCKNCHHPHAFNFNLGLVHGSKCVYSIAIVFSLKTKTAPVGLYLSIYIVERKFKQLLAEDGLKVIATQADGNCLFSAIASQLSYHGFPCSHSQVRRAIIQFIRGILNKQGQVSSLCCCLSVT